MWSVQDQPISRKLLSIHFFKRILSKAYALTRCQIIISFYSSKDIKKYSNLEMLVMIKPFLK